MIILNITFVAPKVDVVELENWLTEAKELFISKAEDIKIYKVLTQIGEENQSYSFQIFFQNEENHEVFRNINFIKIIASCNRKFGEKVLYFDSLLESF